MNIRALLAGLVLAFAFASPAVAEGPTCSTSNGGQCPAEVHQYVGADGHPANVSTSTPVPVHDASPAVPSGGATAANQTTANSSLSTIATNTTGAATGAKQDTGNASLSTIATNTARPIVVTPTDRGGSITTGGTAQNAMASNGSRKGGWCQNPVSATEDLFISTSTSATTTGASDDADLAPGGTFSFTQGDLVIQTAISVNAVTTGHRFICKETQ